MYCNGPVVQWSFLQFKKLNKKAGAPSPVLSQSFTQIGSKLLTYGGCNYNGEAVSQLFLYDTLSYEWSQPGDAGDYQENHGGSRQGHTATLVEMHPPRIMVSGISYGIVVGRFCYCVILFVVYRFTEA